MQICPDYYQTFTNSKAQIYAIRVCDPIVVVPGRDASRSQRLKRISVAQQLLLLHLIQDVLPEHTGEAELTITHQREHQVHQLFQDVLR